MITIYSKQGCAQCVTAENICKMKGVEHKILKLEKDYSLEQLQALTGKPRTAMPVIVLDDQTVTDVAGLAASFKR